MRKIMLTAKWCSSCKIVKPFVEKIDGVEIIDVEVDTDIAEKYGAMSLPAFIVDDGLAFKIDFGARPRKVIEDFYA